MKKLTSILLILALVLSLAACSQTKQPDVNGDSSVSTSGDNTSPIPIAFIGSMTGLDEIYVPGEHHGISVHRADWQILGGCFGV